MDELEQERLRSEVATLRLLLEVNEAAALEQSERAERALRTMQQEVEARERQARLVQQIVDASTDCVIVVDAQWRVKFLNEQAKQALTLDDEAVGQTMMEVLPGMLDPTFMDYYQHAMKNRVTLLFEEFHKPRGMWFGVNVSPVGDGIGIFSGTQRSGGGGTRRLQRQRSWQRWGGWRRRSRTRSTIRWRAW